MMKKNDMLMRAAEVFTLAGTTNWLLVGFLDYNLVESIAGFIPIPFLDKALYMIVGISGFVTVGNSVMTWLKNSF